MTYTIIVLILCMIGLAACEIHPLGTQAKLIALQKAQRHGRHHTVHHRAAGYRGMATVSPEWLDTYRSLESEHGDYTIPDDHRIQVSPTGQIKVPTTVVKHFNDLSKAPAKTKEEE
jgi:hypothetical protein